MTVVTNTPKVKSLQRQSFKKGKKFKRYKKFKSSKTSRALNRKRVIALVPQKPYWQLPLPKETINYKNIVLLRKCITTEGKILPRRVSGLNAKQQRSMSKAIKNCKLIGLLPFISISK